MTLPLLEGKAQVRYAFERHELQKFGIVCFSFGFRPRFYRSRPGIRRAFRKADFAKRTLAMASLGPVRHLPRDWPAGRD